MRRSHEIARQILAIEDVPIIRLTDDHGYFEHVKEMRTVWVHDHGSNGLDQCLGQTAEKNPLCRACSRGTVRFLAIAL